MCFSPKILGLRWCKIFPKNLTDEKITIINNNRWSSQRHIEDACKISRAESKTRRGHSPRNKFPSLNLNQPVFTFYCYLVIVYLVHIVSVDPVYALPLDPNGVHVIYEVFLMEN